MDKVLPKKSHTISILDTQLAILVPDHKTHMDTSNRCIHVDDDDDDTSWVPSIA